MRRDLSSGTGVELPSLGIFNNAISTNSVVVASPNGSSILVAEADGNLLLYDANADSFTVSRKDVTALSGAYAASAFHQYVIGNNLLNSSLVPMLQLNAGSNSSSGFAFVDQAGYLTTVPVARTATGSGTETAPGTAALATTYTP